MQAISKNMDKAAISLSLLCVLHCLAAPIAIVMLPALGATFLEDERFHAAILLLVLPTSMLGLGLGCFKHGRVRVAVTGLIGLSVLFMALILGEGVIGEVGEKVITVVGTAIIAVAHLRNYLLCQNLDCHVNE